MDVYISRGHIWHVEFIGGELHCIRDPFLYCFSKYVICGTFNVPWLV